MMGGRSQKIPRVLWFSAVRHHPDDGAVGFSAGVFSAGGLAAFFTAFLAGFFPAFFAAFFPPFLAPFLAAFFAGIVFHSISILKKVGIRILCYAW